MMTLQAVNAAIGAWMGGLGIGLSLVKRLVDMHGGNVAIDSAGRARMRA